MGIEELKNSARDPQQLANYWDNMPAQAFVNKLKSWRARAVPGIAGRFEADWQDWKDRQNPVVLVGMAVEVLRLQARLRLQRHEERDQG